MEGGLAASKHFSRKKQNKHCATNPKARGLRLRRWLADKLRLSPALSEDHHDHDQSCLASHQPFIWAVFPCPVRMLCPHTFNASVTVNQTRLSLLSQWSISTSGNFPNKPVWHYNWHSPDCWEITSAAQSKCRWTLLWEENWLLVPHDCGTWSIATGLSLVNVTVNESTGLLKVPQCDSLHSAVVVLTWLKGTCLVSLISNIPVITTSSALLVTSGLLTFWWWKVP